MSDYDYCDYDGPEFYDESWHVAKKAHRCAECGTAIRPGEKYLNCRGKWDGDFSVFKQHFVCLEACLAAREYMKNNCVPFGGLLEWSRDYDSDTKKKCWTPRLRKALAAVHWKRRQNIICGVYEWNDSFPSSSL